MAFLSAWLLAFCEWRARVRGRMRDATDRYDLKKRLRQDRTTQNCGSRRNVRGVGAVARERCDAMRCDAMRCDAMRNRTSPAIVSQDAAAA
ncbi:hypothetical protein WJ17_00980 [Burkholderia vietnamiensis]|nr:hypothetical protein WI92_02205 [Burkholderia vietnamiensis]KVF72698.1 hypothetical protein WJ17_00980 [Burkholderia vietnamiensis]CAG9192319.1 hypothetical protein BVI2075_180038 [Burkholderia vietnamiensis]